MKKLSMMCMAALLLLAASCKKEKKTELGDGIGFRATTEAHGGNGKTHLDGELNVLWDMGDEIQVYSSAGGDYSSKGLKFKATEVDGSKAGFNGYYGPAPEAFFTGPYTAYYPAGMTAEGHPGQITLPATQTYAENSFAPGANPMVAKADDADLAFRNICGVLQLHLQSTSACTVTNIAVTTLGSENLWGTGTVGLDDPAKPTLSALTDGGKTVTLDCSKETGGGVDISSEKMFRIVVPAGSLGSSFEVKLTASDGNVWKKTATGAQNKIDRSCITKLEADGISTHTPVTPESVTISAGCVDCTYTLSGSVNVSGTHVCEYGIVYSETDATPTIGEENVSKLVVNTESITGKKDFTVDITKLTEDVKYYVRTYAIIDDIKYSPDATVQTVTYSTPKPLSDKWIKGKSPKAFTVGMDGSKPRKVYFSQGNLQYRAQGGSGGNASATAASGKNVGGTWRFAEHQFDIVGDATVGNVYEGGVKCDNANLAQTYTGWIDLFGWGTSGYNHNDACYQPWSTSTTTSTTYSLYYAYGSWDNNLEEGLYPHTGKADWGKANSISNGGTNSWRTLTGGDSGEWYYLINSRTDADKLYGLGAVGNCMRGMIILPDDWSWSGDVAEFGPDALDENRKWKPGITDWANVYTYSEWAMMEASGAVFLPAAGLRNGTSASSVGGAGGYWSSSYSAANFARFLYFIGNYVEPNYHYDRFWGWSVRLVSEN